MMWTGVDGRFGGAWEGCGREIKDVREVVNVRDRILPNKRLICLLWQLDI